MGIPTGTEDRKQKTFSFPLQTKPEKKVCLLCLTFVLHEVRMFFSLCLTSQVSNSLKKDSLKMKKLLHGGIKWKLKAAVRNSVESFAKLFFVK